MLYRKLMKHVHVMMLLFPALVSCSSPQKDAEKAAALSNRSIEHIMKMEYDKAEQMYLQVRELVEKYSDESPKSDVFRRHYYRYMQEEN